MKKNNEIITNDIDKFPEFENIRNAILEAREKVATTVNFAMVSAYWTIGKQLHEAMSGDGSIYGKQLIKYVSVRLSEDLGKDLMKEICVICDSFMRSIQNGTQCVPN